MPIPRARWNRSLAAKDKSSRSIGVWSELSCAAVVAQGSFQSKESAMASKTQGKTVKQVLSDNVRRQQLRAPATASPGTSARKKAAARKRAAQAAERR